MASKYRVLFMLAILYCGAEASIVKHINDWHVVVNSVHQDVSGINGMYSLGKKMGFVLDNQYYLKEDSRTKWMANEFWNYTSYFNGSDLITSDNVNLVLDGVDTFAEIILNNQKIAFTENMFRQYVLDVKKHLQKDSNELKIIFHSPLNYAVNQSTQYNYKIPPECPDPAYNGDCHVNKIRKMQASFSWDWGPSMPSIGIWKPVYFEAYNETVIRHVVVDTELIESRWKLSIDVYFQNNKKNAVTGSLVLASGNKNNVFNVNIKPNTYGDLVYSTSYLIDSDKVEWWWPNGYGEQNLYNLTATFKVGVNEESKKTVRFGFRDVVLIQDKIGSSGLSFYFKVNGLPIFAKGSNLIPIDLLPENGQDPATIKKLFDAAKSAHMNMLRVWGGGVYESDALYDLADEYGIMIWQDFMFACALYPTDTDYLNNVVEEVRYQVKRLRSHPSIVLYSGNNENEGALVDNWWGIGDKTRYIEDYVKLYVKTIKTEFDRLTHSRGIYVTSSPSNGLQTANEGYLSKQPSSSYYGDVHFYDYTSDTFDPTIYPIPRFASEYGFQSLPSADSFLKDTDNATNLYIYSDFMKYRQHHPSGNAQLLSMIEKQLTLPSVSSFNYNLAVIYYSQIVQAYSYKIQTERYRNYRSILTGDGRGNTMGALYWQLNDVWAAPTWSSIDYYGRWKLLQYYAVKFFSPVLISGHIEKPNILNIYVASDHANVNERAFINYYKWGNVTPVRISYVDVNITAYSSKLVYEYTDLDEALKSHGCTATTCFMTLTMPGAPDNIVFPAHLKDSSVNTANVKITSVVQNGTAFDVTVSSDNIALFVWLDAHSIVGHFSDNGFLQIGGTKIIKFFPDATVSLKDLKAALTVTHLRDTKYF